MVLIACCKIPFVKCIAELNKNYLCLDACNILLFYQEPRTSANLMIGRSGQVLTKAARYEFGTKGQAHDDNRTIWDIYYQGYFLKFR
jgi:hypothetical protein